MPLALSVWIPTTQHPCAKVFEYRPSLLEKLVGYLKTPRPNAIENNKGNFYFLFKTRPKDHT
jgi:hypothetical protein